MEPESESHVTKEKQKANGQALSSTESAGSWCSNRTEPQMTILHIDHKVALQTPEEPCFSS